MNQIRKQNLCPKVYVSYNNDYSHFLPGLCQKTISKDDIIYTFLFEKPMIIIPTIKVSTPVATQNWDPPVIT
jgi:hypothetical protein